MPSELGPLRTIAIEDGDVDLFPEKVLRLHDEGRCHEARTLLRQCARGERDAARRDKQLELSGRLELWGQPVKGAPTLFTLNGCGVRIYAGAVRPDGARIGVHWITVLFVPVVPIDAYLVTPTSDGWRFHAHLPLPPWTYGVPAGFTGVAALFALTVILPLAWWDRTHVEVVAYNGFASPLELTIGAEHQRIPPGEHREFRDLPTAPVEVAAAGPDGRTIEAFTADLSDHGGELAVYNPLARAVLARNWIRYGRGDPPEGEILPPISWHLLPSTDYVFVEPPAEKRVKGSGYIEDSVLEALELPPDIRLQHEALAEGGFVEHAVVATEAEWRLHPEDLDLVYLVVAHRTSVDAAAGQAHVRRLRDELPGDVGVHRAYQDLSGLDRDEIRREYDARLAAAPDDAMAHYLAGRVVPDPPSDGPPSTAPQREALAHYLAALERDPGYLPALRAAANAQARLGDYAPAADLYARYETGGGLADAVLYERLSLAQILGHDPVAVLTPDPSALTLADFFAVERAPAEVGRIVGEVLARDPTIAADQRAWLESELRLVAGDLRTTRERATVEPASLVALRLALSDGATAMDRADAVARLGSPDDLAPHMQVLGFALISRVDAPGRPQWERSLADAGLAWVPALLDDAGLAAHPEQVDLAMAGRIDLRDRGAVWSALAFLHPSEALRAQARRFALPNDRPYFAR